MEPRRRIFWMLSNAFMALLFSRCAPLLSVVFVLSASIWISHNALAITVEGRRQ